MINIHANTASNTILLIEAYSNDGLFVISFSSVRRICASITTNTEHRSIDLCSELRCSSADTSTQHVCFLFLQNSAHGQHIGIEGIQL